ncbi:NAD(P)-dependent malic enzyme [Cytobacillus kochii]|uniref:NAD(P)-dependent malic enzyme n=1 Tax=Cytobacillus kochii TaxID=859143 RepID=UPI00203CB32A|nr:malic enzyme-like NAD(P)-binding protein [Cytobacillus kochii]MCM3321566.1 NAD-dependent malic enzyme [Cytobacillus kochii]MCM3343600.1 NAD-dependent malic enzyme [Cytobacillus kochii]MDM5207431.1 malic enzyme-like NAD(P)-binding protein [Cytobacillus kochii]
MELKEKALALHRLHKGKLSISTKVPVKTKEDLSLAYSPGVAEPCLKIAEHEESAYEYTSKGNMVAVVSDGSAVLGLGNIGAQASLPVMEGKAILFKEFANVDAVPICLQTNDVDEIVRTVKLLEPSFGGVNLEDISAPRCFEIEQRLIEECGIPVFHDDQHGTAIVTVAGLINSLKVVGKKLDEIKVVVNGAGAAGISIIKLLRKLNVGEMILCDTKGMIYSGREEGMNAIKEEVAKITNSKSLSGTLKEAINGADVFIGVSAAGVLSKEMVQTMNRDAIIFAMANPSPEIMPKEAKDAGAAIIGTGRSDFPNQVNNVLAFPGIFRGALDVGAKVINEEMKIAAAYAIAGMINEEKLTRDYIIPDPFDTNVAHNVAKAVSEAAISTGVTRNAYREPIFI